MRGTADCPNQNLHAPDPLGARRNRRKYQDLTAPLVLVWGSGSGSMILCLYLDVPSYLRLEE